MWVSETPSPLLLPSRLSSPPPPIVTPTPTPSRQGGVVLWAWRGGGAAPAGPSAALATPWPHACPGPSSSPCPVSPPSLCAGHPPSAVTPSLPAACTPRLRPTSPESAAAVAACAELQTARPHPDDPRLTVTGVRRSHCVSPRCFVQIHVCASGGEPHGSIQNLGWPPSPTPPTASLCPKYLKVLPFCPRPRGPGLGHRRPHWPPCLQARPAPIHSTHSNQSIFLEGASDHVTTPDPASEPAPFL